MRPLKSDEASFSNGPAQLVAALTRSYNCGIQFSVVTTGGVFSNHGEVGVISNGFCIRWVLISGVFLTAGGSGWAGTSGLENSEPDLRVVIDSEGIAARGPSCLKLPFNRMTALSLQIVNKTESRSTLQISGTSRVFGLVPFKATVEPQSQVRAALEAVPLLTGEIDVDLLLKMGAHQRTLKQRFCVLPTGRLLIRIHDGDDRVVSARLRVTGSDGRTYAPDGVVESPFETDGLLELELPAGKAVLKCAHAGERNPSSRKEKVVEVDIPVDRTKALEVRLP